MPSIISDLGGNLPAGALCGSTPTSGYQAGSVTHSHVLRTASLSGVSNPIVVLGPPSFNGADPSTTRVRNVTSTSFQHNLQEWDYLDGSHVNETIGYLALSAGAGSLGSLDVDAGSRNLNHNWVTVNFSQTFAAPPVVIAQVASFNGGQAVTTRVRNVTSSSFQVRLQEEEGNDGSHVNETLHWIAIETGSTTVGGKRIVAGRTGNSVTGNFATINFGQTVANPVFLAEMQTFDGADPGALRHDNLTTTSAQVKVEEEASSDAETGHTTEVVGWVVIQD